MPGDIVCVELRAQETPPPAALADPDVKIVHCVRHGQGTHNRFADTITGAPCHCPDGPCAYRSPEHEDAALTDRGRIQAGAAGAALRMLPGAAVEAVYVSPLTRTLQTATIAVPGGRVPLHADERLRERYGVHVCDRRSPRAALEPAFPTVDFSAIPHGEDPLHKPDDRETNDHVASRAKDFLLSIRARPQKTVAIVAHSAFWREFMRGAVVTPDPNVQRKFSTGEVRYIMLTYT